MCSMVRGSRVRGCAHRSSKDRGSTISGSSSTILPLGLGVVGLGV